MRSKEDESKEIHTKIHHSQTSEIVLKKKTEEESVYLVLRLTELQQSKLYGIGRGIVI